MNYFIVENNDGDRGVMRIQGIPGGDGLVSVTFIKATERFNIQSAFILNAAATFLFLSSLGRLDPEHYAGQEERLHCFYLNFGLVRIFYP